VILGGVEHLEEGRARVAAPVGSHLVDLIEHDDRVHRPRVAQGTHESTRQGPDVRTPMTTDLRLVADPAERHPHELASRGTRDRLADRGLPGPRRPDQGEDGARAPVLDDAALTPKLADGDVLGDAVLHVVEARVVGVEHLARVHRVEPLLRALRPGHGDQPVEVGADHRGLARLLSGALEACELALRLLADLLRHRRLLDLSSVLVDH